MYKLAICDDDICSLTTIKKEIEALPYDFTISCYTSPLQLLEDFKKNPTNIVCLDIEMEELSGFDLATKLKNIYHDVLIVFITQHSGLVMKSINYRPIGFIRKGEYSKLNETFTFVMSELQILHNICSLSYDNLSYNLKEKDIIYFKKQGNILHIYTKKGEIQIRKSLKQIEGILNPKLFIKINKSTIVNIRQIHTIDKTNRTILLNNHDTIVYGRTYKDELHHFYANNILKKA